MRNRRTREFRKRFDRLPADVQEQAKASYRLFKKNPYYPSLHFECIDRHEPRPRCLRERQGVPVRIARREHLIRRRTLGHRHVGRLVQSRRAVHVSHRDRERLVVAQAAVARPDRRPVAPRVREAGR